MTRKKNQHNETDTPNADAPDRADPQPEECGLNPPADAPSDESPVFDAESSAPDQDFPGRVDMENAENLGDFATDDEQPTLEQEIQRLHQDLDAAEDRMLRAHAELDNFRKRIDRQMSDERRYAAVPLLRDLLPVWDNMHRALEAADTASDVASVVEGLKIVADQLTAVFERHQCKRIGALHEPFDPNRHESIMVQPSEEFAPNTVLMEVQAGFQLHDRVVRPTQVIVSMKPEPSSPDDE